MRSMMRLGLLRKKNYKIALILVILCFTLSGCVFISKNKKTKQQIAQIQESVLEKEKEISKRDQEIARLKGLLKEFESKLNEKDEKIEQLRKKLEMFGVWEK